MNKKLEKKSRVNGFKNKPLLMRKSGMNTLAVLSGATRLWRSMDSHIELLCFSMTPGKTRPPVCTTAQRPAIK